ncbi:MAG: alkaline phosphatase [Chlorobi bacterium]|nr:alkaline phosphatase [Chlorobiota bacterium]
MKKALLLFIIVFVSLPSIHSQENYKNKHEKLIYENKDFYDVKVYPDDIKFKKHPKNIILLIGDGMGVAQVFAGITANRGMLNIATMKNIGFSKTQSADNYITDSAAGGTALACGVKTKNGVIGEDPDGNKVKSILEIAEENGKATGLVATSAITHATPASFIAHVPNRRMYEEIATDFVNSGIDVFIGGGYDFFVKRKDGRNLEKEMEDKGYSFYTSLDSVPESVKSKLAVLTAPKHNPQMPERGNMLPEATEKALDVLDGSSTEGFFLMVEGSQIDWGGHQNDVAYITRELLDFDKAVGKALEYAATHKNTLVIVTADHETGGLSNTGKSIKDGIVEGAFTVGHHTGIMVPVFAFGPGAEEFRGIYENVEIFKKMKALYNFK